MTIEEIKKAFQNLTDRVNRIEATVAHNKPVVIAEHPDLVEAIESAIVILDRATELLGHQSKEYTRIVDELRSGR